MFLLRAHPCHKKFSGHFVHRTNSICIYGRRENNKNSSRHEEPEGLCTFVDYIIRAVPTQYESGEAKRKSLRRGAAHNKNYNMRVFGCRNGAAAAAA